MGLKIVGLAVLVFTLMSNESSSQTTICLHFGNNPQKSCNDWYGPPISSTPCLHMQCIAGLCPLPWEYAPIMGNYDIEYTEATEQVGNQSIREAELVTYPCYNAHVCEVCWVDQNRNGLQFCGLQMNPQLYFRWWVLFYDEIGKCPPVFTSAEPRTDSRVEGTGLPVSIRYRPSELGGN